MEIATYKAIKQQVIDAGYAAEIQWCADLKPCTKASVFLCEYIWVVLNSGMKNQVAVKINEKVIAALRAGEPVKSVFKHPGKAAAIGRASREYKDWFRDYRASYDKLAYLQSLPWIGPITKYHLAKNLGINCVKPDRHLMRIARESYTTPDALCARLAEQSGDRACVVDGVLWRAANLRMI